MVPVEVLINFGPLLQVLRVPVVRKMVLVHKVSHNGGTVCVATERERECHHFLLTYHLGTSA